MFKVLGQDECVKNIKGVKNVDKFHYNNYIVVLKWPLLSKKLFIGIGSRM